MVWTRHTFSRYKENKTTATKNQPPPNKVAKLCLFVTPSCSSVHGILQARILEWVVISFSRASSQPREQTQVFYVAGSLLTVLATRKSKNTGMGSHSLLQGIFLMQGSNHGLFHSRQILYLLSHPQKTKTKNPEGEFLYKEGEKTTYLGKKSITLRFSIK